MRDLFLRWYNKKKITPMSFIEKKSAFHKALEARVSEYFAKNNLSEKGNWSLYFKTVFWLLSMISTYIVLISSPELSISWQVALCLLHGFSWACIGFNVVHDAAHGSYSENKKLNEVVSYLFDVVGASNYFWRTKHNVLHHTYTNIEGIDDDIDTGNALRFSPHQKHRWWHYFQPITAGPLYSLIYILWISQKDIHKYINKKIGTKKIPAMSTTQKRLFWFFKILYVSIYFIIPISIFGINGFIGWCIAASFCGLVIAIVFQLAHIVGKAHFPIPTENGDIQSDFATHQIITTVDFATKDPITSWFVGGLNFQVVHHLFPQVSHIHYPKIQKIVKKTCLEYGIKYNEYRTTFGALWAHFWHITKLGFNIN